MSNPAPKPKRRAKFVDRALELVTLNPKPDEAAEDHPTATQSGCGARAWQAGRLVECELPKLHGGRHSASGRTWRPRSGDAG